MKDSEAIELIRGAVDRPGGTWADLGAGDGTFTRALMKLLGPTARIYAVDRDARALARLRRSAIPVAANVVTVVADFLQPFELPGLGETRLDGMLLANALHFVPDADLALARFAAWLRPGGRIVLVEYDRRRASRWVPYPLAPDRLQELAPSAGLSTPIITATRASAYGGDLYVAVADRLER